MPADPESQETLLAVIPCGSTICLEEGDPIMSFHHCPLFFSSKFFFLTAFLSVFILIAAVTGCPGDNGQTDGGNAFFNDKDLAGQSVVLKSEPDAIVSLAPSNTEIVFSVGAGAKLVGVTTFCDYPEEAQKIEKIGELVTISLEKIIRLDPDLVLAGNKILPETRRTLENAGIPVAVTEGTSIQGMLDSITLIGRITGKTAAAAALVTSLQARIALVDEKTRGLAKPRAYYIVSFGQYGNWTCGPGSFIDEMIALAGGENVAKDIGQAWAEFSLERLIALDPQILLAGRFSGPLEALATEPGYRDLTAVKNNRIAVLDDSLVGRPGPRLVDGLLEMAAALHPEIDGQ